MDQTLDCIMLARRKESERKKMEECLTDKGDRTIIVDRHRLEFDVNAKTVTITRASRDVPFAWKIGGCRMPYEVLIRLLDGNLNDMEGFE